MVLSANGDKSKKLLVKKDFRLKQLQLLRADMHPKKYWDGEEKYAGKHGGSELLHPCKGGR